jgi:hypothetical protein
VNFTTLLAGMVISSPVRGLRPLRAARSATLKEPKPVKVTESPALSASVITAMVASRADSAWVLEFIPALAAIF